MSQLKSLRGMVDVLPSETHIWQAIEAIAYSHFRRAGISEIRTPILESTELFARGIGEETDVVGKEMYSFLDRGERSCTLRPEGTASVVRAAIENGLLNKGAQKLWYAGPMFRYERPQAGRQRQFHQIGIEFLGLGNSRNDAEVIGIAWNLLKDLGVQGLVLEINSLGNNEDRKEFRSKFVAWIESHIEELDNDSRKRVRSNPLRIIDSKDKGTQSLLAHAPKLKDSLSEESKTRFSNVQKYLKDLDIPFKINNNLVRGLDYYDHTAFEITSHQLGAQATVCGGGRYNRLINQLGGPSTPAIGWAIGLERLILLIKNASKDDPKGKAAHLIEQKKPDIYIVNRGNEAERKALVLSQHLRSAGLKVELDYSSSAFGKQFKRADRSGAIWALVLGDEEISTGQGRLKCLKEEYFGDKSKNNEKLFNLDDLESLITEIDQSKKLN